jgi:nicotinamidase-related amidase
MGGASNRVKKGKVLPCVLMDVNTQLDFLDPQGSAAVLNHAELIPSLRRVVAWAKRNQTPVISAVDSHRADEIRKCRLPQHCLDDTPGQEKVAFTLFDTHVRVESDNTLAVPIDLFRRHQQVIFRKRTNDFFLNPKADRFITNLPAAEYILTGLSLEGSVKAIALGLIARNKKVTVVIDATGFHDRSQAEMTSRLLQAKGVELIDVNTLLQRRLPRPWRYPRRIRVSVTAANGRLMPNGQHGVSPQHATRMPSAGNGAPASMPDGNGFLSAGPGQ